MIMRTVGLGRAACIGWLLLMGVSGPLEAQIPPGQDPPGQDPAAQNPASQDPATQTQRPDSIALVFEREVFYYPQYERRDPFKSLASGDESGPRFEVLQLLGVISSPEPGGSVALLGPRADRADRPSAVRTYRVRQGDQLGNIRILQIQETRIVVEVEEFGLREQRIMELQRPGQGGLS